MFIVIRNGRFHVLQNGATGAENALKLKERRSTSPVQLSASKYN